MSVDVQKTVAEIVLEKPRTGGVFERLGIDYCCHGRVPLSEACRSAGLDVNQVVEQLEVLAASEGSSGDSEDWSVQSLASLISHIVEKHHTYCREEGSRLEPLLAKVVSKHGDRHPELRQIQEVFLSLRDELSLHLMKEERMLFPHIAALENASTHHTTPPRAPFGAVQNPVRMMMQEHDSAGQAVKAIRELTSNYTVPEGVCNSFRVLYKSLADFETDLHRHIHLENNLLFPRALKLEDAAQGV